MATRAESTSATSLVGRAEELAAVRETLQRRGCVLAGASGVGKSRLAVEATVGEPTVLRVLATATAAAIPYGAVSHLLPPDVGTDHSVIPAFISSLREHHGDVPPVILVDDGHLLDAGSATLVHAIVTSGSARVLVTIRSNEPANDAVTSLWKDQGLRRIELQPLGRTGAGELVAALLGGIVHAAAQARIFDLTQGNPMFIDELVRDARRTGALHQTTGRWNWREELLEFDRIGLLVERRVHKVSVSARRALELLAIAAPLPLAIVAELATPRAIEELERLRLITVTSGDRGTDVVNLAHPMFGEVVAAELPVTTGRRLRRELAEAVAASPHAVARDDLLVATWLLEAGERDHPERFVEASTEALRRGAPDLARQLATAAGDSVEAALAHAAALVGLARYDEAAATLAPHEDAMPDASLSTSIAFVETQMRALVRGAGADGPAARALLEGAAGWHRGAEWESVIGIQHAWTALYSGRSREAMAAARRYADDPRVSPLQRFNAAAVASLAAGRLFRLDDVTALLDRITELVGALSMPPWEVGFAQLMIGVMPRILDGRDLLAITAELHAAATAAERNGDTPLLAAAHWGLGATALRRGHADDAVAELQLAANALHAGDPGNTLVGVLTDLTFALFYQGDHAGVAQILQQLEDAAARRAGTLSRGIGEISRARALAAAAAGRVSEAQEALLAFAEHEQDDLAEAWSALVDALTLGGDPRRVATRLEQLDADVQSELGGLVVAHANALVADDPEALQETALSYRERGLDLLAAQAANAAARGFRRQGLADSSRRAAALAVQVAGRCVGTVIPGLAPALHVPDLTSREREIALLVARGMSNREIAEQLVLSVRTIESTILRACRKLGVDNRQALSNLVTP